MSRSRRSPSYPDVPYWPTRASRVRTSYLHILPSGDKTDLQVNLSYLVRVDLWESQKGVCVCVCVCVCIGGGGGGVGCRERREAGRDVQDRSTCRRGLEARRAKNQWGKDVRSMVTGDRGPGLWEVVPDAEGLQKARLGLC